MVRAAVSRFIEATATGTTASPSTWTTRQPHGTRYRVTPGLLVPQVAAVADHDGGIAGERDGDALR